MENNCLVTKLKGAVNDSSLLKLNELRWTIGAGKTIPISFKQKNSVSATLSIISGTGEFQQENSTVIGTTLTLTPNATFYGKVVATTDIVISCDTTGLDFEKMDFMQSPGLLKDCYFRALSQEGLKNVQINGWDGELTIDEIKDAIPNIENMEMLSIGSEGITGEIADLVDFTNLTNIYFALGLLRTTMSGSIDVYAQGVASSRAAGSTCGVIGNGIITYKVNGVDTVINVGGRKTITFNGSGGYSIA